MCLLCGSLMALRLMEIDFVELKQSIGHYPKAEMIAWDWTGVDLRKEAQGIDPKRTDSIQFRVIEELKIGCSG